MKTERAIITVRGRVQRVGYRDYVAEIGNRLNLGGIVENLPDNTVRVIVEADKKTLNEFISLIRPKDEPMIKVTGVDVSYAEPSGEYDYFDIKYGDFSEEGFERIGVAAENLKSLNRKQDQAREEFGKKMDSLGEKLDNGFSGVNFSVNHLDKNITDRFDRMDLKYDKISDRMEKMDWTLEKLADAILKLAEK
jgi:acylphosphatase